MCNWRRVTHLEDAHAVRVAQDLVRVAVVAVPDAGGGHEQREGVLRLRVQQAPLHLLLDLALPLLLVTALAS